jgi:hypothetical protein
MALPLTHSSVNGLSEKLTSLDIGLHHKAYTLEKEHQCHTPMDQLCNATELCIFIGYVNFYYDMLPNCAHILKPLIDQASLTTYFIDRQNAKGICKMHLLMAANAFAACPNHSKWFGIHTNASDFQLGTCIHERKPVAYFSCKLTMSQQNYTTLEKEILSIIAILKEF